MANRVGVEVDLLASLDVGQARLFVQEEDQRGSLAQLEANRPAANGLPGQAEEVRGEHGAVGR
jgi:hypothetical protein